MERDEQAEWRAQRDHAVAEHATAERRRREAETAQARELIVAFAAEAAERGLRTTELRAYAFDANVTYRTKLVGWYIHTNRTLAVGTDGTYYVLGVSSSLRNRLLGADVPPADPHLIIGRGARDGESVPLATLLRWRLDGGDNWP